ncbi:ATP-binding cassette domain-containing protein [Sphingomonas solaris]|uniref:ATP-binding cassette domain-containing protein n=1 Tax=Alterirhizorhabdus solaris TaxID=2529389 RepID=A0A558QVV6_9SPHN|nr:ATP-binding cassette domain-containing protein [Sphingomonas solaris]TVV71283.1 ATP-binding cassette domain-containing protein [Sphingomonas solaris]
MSGPALAFEDVTRTYPGVAAPAVDGVSAQIAGGSFVALVGASGSGKSTLLKMVNRLEVPDGGRVTIDGDDVADGPAPRLRRRIGYVFQHVGLFPHMSVAENIAMVPRLSGKAAARSADVDVAALLDQVGLPADYATRPPAALSGGQRQRVGVARALAGGARLMLLDEPFGALDPVTRDRLCDTYRGLHDRLGLTTLMVTHDMAEALLMADRILVMAAGRLVADATPGEMLSGAAGPEATALVDVPRRQSARLQALAAA